MRGISDHPPVRLILGLSLAVAGGMVDVFIVRPVLLHWPFYSPVTQDIPYLLYKLLVVNLPLLPALGTLAAGVVRTSTGPGRRTRWLPAYVAGFGVLVLLVLYFSAAVGFPQHGM